RPRAPLRGRRLRAQWAGSLALPLSGRQGGLRPVSRAAPGGQGIPLGDRGGTSRATPTDTRGRLATDAQEEASVCRRGPRRAQGRVARGRSVSLDAGTVGGTFRVDPDRGPGERDASARNPAGSVARDRRG